MKSHKRMEGLALLKCLGRRNNHSIFLQGVTTLNLIEEAYLVLVAPELLPRRGIIRTILVLLTLFTFYQPLMELLPDPPSVDLAP